ncbi:MAG: D-2-hydroxyacid dehydrogenase [Streptosporangiaceae bacterium]
MRPLIVIATPLQPELASEIGAELSDYQVCYEPELLPPVRYPCDHRGQDGFRRTGHGQRRWTEMLLAAEVTFGIPGDDPDQLRWLVRESTRLRFVQATSAGAGQQVEAAGLSDDELARVVIATSSGVHAGPLAEFALLGILAFARGLPRLQDDRAARRWEHYPVRDVAGRTVVILGTGAIGSRIAQLAKAAGMYVIGINSSGKRPEAPVDEFFAVDRLAELASRADVLVITLPETPDTLGLVDARVLAALPAGAVVVNVGRGRVVDEDALIGLLQAGRLAGAALDVTAKEPPDPDSPLWTLPNVILSPHTAALSPLENKRITELFIDNVRRLDTGRPIRNRITAVRRY